MKQRGAIIRRPFEPEPVTDATERDYEERQAALLAAPASASSVRFAIERRYYHEIPVLRSVAATWDGRIWVQRRGDEPLSDGPIDILSPEGEYFGTYRAGATEMPDAFGPGGLAAFIEFDEFDVASVVGRRLPTDVR